MHGLIFNSMLLPIPMIEEKKKSCYQPSTCVVLPHPKVPGSSQQMGMAGAEGVAHLVMLLFTAL